MKIIMICCSVLLLLAAPVLCAPVVSGVVVAPGSLVINGTGFGQRATTAPLYFSNFENELPGGLPLAQLTNLTRWGEVAATRAYSGLNSELFSYCAYAAGVTAPCANGSQKENWRRSVIDLGVSGPEKVYTTFWLYLDKSTSTASNWQWKGPVNLISKTDSNGTRYPGSWYYDSSSAYPGPWPAVQNYQETSAHTGTWWRQSPEGFFNNAGFLYWYDIDNRKNQQGAASAGRPADSYLWGQWHRMEWYGQRSSAPGVADGKWSENRIGRANPNFNIVDGITHVAGNDPWRYVALSHAVASVMDGYVDFKAYMDDVYVDSTPARVELCDSSQWATRTHCEIQFLTSWTESQIVLNVNPGGFTTGQKVYAYVLDAAGSVSNDNISYIIGSASPPLAVKNLKRIPASPAI